MIVNIIKVYLLIGTVLIIIQQGVLIYGRKKWFESKESAMIIAEILAFFVKIIIWPLELYWMISAVIKVLTGTLSGEELEWYMEGYEEGCKIREKRSESK